MSTDNFLETLRATLTDVGTKESRLIDVIGEALSTEETFANIINEIPYSIIGTEHGTDAQQKKMMDEVEQQFRYLDKSLHQLQLSNNSLAKSNQR